MVATSIRRSRAARHIDDGDIVADGGGIILGTVLLADISGVTWTRARLDRLAAAVQAQMDDRRLITDLVSRDPDRQHAEAGDDQWFTDTYGGRMFIDGNSIVSRSDVISFTLEDGDLFPQLEAP